MSGIAAGILGGAPDWGWRAAFLIGLAAAPPVVWAATGQMPVQTVPSSAVGLVAAGLLVGLGTALGLGCTSGHGVCGLARLSVRSLTAVATFLATGAATVFGLRHLL